MVAALGINTQICVCAVFFFFFFKLWEKLCLSLFQSLGICSFHFLKTPHWVLCINTLRIGSLCARPAYLWPRQKSVTWWECQCCRTNEQCSEAGGLLGLLTIVSFQDGSWDLPFGHWQVLLITGCALSWTLYWQIALSSLLVSGKSVRCWLNGHGPVLKVACSGW